MTAKLGDSAGNVGWGLGVGIRIVKSVSPAEQGVLLSPLGEDEAREVRRVEGAVEGAVKGPRSPRARETTSIIRVDCRHTRYFAKTVALSFALLSLEVVTNDILYSLVHPLMSQFDHSRHSSVSTKEWVSNGYKYVLYTLSTLVE